MLNRRKRMVFGASIYHSDDSEGFKYISCNPDHLSSPVSGCQMKFTSQGNPHVVPNN